MRIVFVSGAYDAFCLERGTRIGPLVTYAVRTPIRADTIDAQWNLFLGAFCPGAKHIVQDTALVALMPRVMRAKPAAILPFGTL